MALDAFCEHVLVRGFSPREVKRLGKVLVPTLYSSGEFLCEEGVVSRGMWLVTAGRLRVSQRSEGGDRTIANLQAPTVVGELGLISGSAAVCTVTAQLPVEAYLLTHEEYRVLRDTGDLVFTKLLDNLAQAMVHRLVASNERFLQVLDPQRRSEFRLISDQLTYWQQA